MTVPFKFDAFKFCEPAASALAAEAATRSIFRAGKIRGYNTDGSDSITHLEHNLGLTIHCDACRYGLVRELWAF